MVGCISRQLGDRYIQVLIVQNNCIEQYFISLILCLPLLVKPIFIIEFSSQEASILTKSKDNVNFSISPLCCVV